MKTIAQLILSALLLVGTPLLAEKERPFLDEASTDRDDVEDPEPWKELNFELPPYPQDSDLMEFQVDKPDSQFKYFVDGKNIQLGDDGVVRLTLVIKSRTGAANVSYEGLRCDIRQFKVYAYGVRGAFKLVKGAEWEKLKQTGYDRYRLDLRDFYLCQMEEHRPLEIDNMLHRLREGPPRNRDERSFF
jgi:hypothetical protein